MRISTSQKLSIAVFLAALALIAYTSRAGEEAATLESALGADIYQACGLEKLSPEEANQLFNVWRSQPCYSFLQESAVNYLDANGYRRVIVVGYGQFDLIGNGSTDEFLIAHHAGKQYILDPPLSAEPLTPGLYWAKESGSTMNIILPSGKDDDYWVRKIR